MTLFDLAGFLGVTSIIGAYLLLQTGRLASETTLFSAVNALGAGLIIISLTSDFNASAMAVEGFWLVLSVYGIYRSTRPPARVFPDSGGCVPSLLAADMDATRRFYEDVLEFRQTGCQAADGRVTWMEMTRDKAVVQFFSDSPVGIGDRPAMTGTVYICTRGVDAFAARVARRTALAWGPETMPYEMREMAVKDPNGYVVAFSEEA